MRRLAFLISVCGLAIALRLVIGAALVSQGGPRFVLASDDGDAYDAAARWQALGTPIVMTDRLLGKWDPATPVEARWPQGCWLFLAAQSTACSGPPRSGDPWRCPCSVWRRCGVSGGHTPPGAIESIARSPWAPASCWRWFRLSPTTWRRWVAWLSSPRGGAEALRDQSSRGDSLIERAFTLFVVGGWVPLGEPPISNLGGLGPLAGRLGEWALAAVGGAWLIARGGRCTGAPGWLLVAAAGATVGPALLIGLPLVRYRVPADPIFIIWMVAGVQALRGAQKQAAPRSAQKQAAPRGGQK